MKKILSILLQLSIIFIPLFNMAIAEEAEHSKAIIYDYLLEPFLEIDELLQNSDTVKITHCQVVDSNAEQEVDLKTQPENTYEGLGSCLYEAIPFQKTAKNIAKKYIYIHMLINENEETTLILSWDTISLADIWNAYWNNTLTPLSNSFVLTAMKPHTISDVLNKITGLENTDAPIDEIQIKIQPYPQAEQVSSITLTALNRSETVYSLEVVTDYYIGSENFFISSRDKYEMSNENEIH